MASPSNLAKVVDRYESQLLADWLRELARAGTRTSSGVISEGELRAQTSEFLSLFRRAVSGDSDAQNTPEWRALRTMLGQISRSRGAQGFTPSETAAFVFSLKQPLLTLLRREAGTDADDLANDWRLADELLDALGLHTIDVYQEGRDDVIRRQQEDMLELSTPVVNLWDGILALPVIGTLDSARTQVVMENLLQRIVETGAELAIIDITGVPTVDTLTAQHLLKTVTAARLMGAECIISGIRPQIAQTIVHLGVDLTGVTTKATIADAFALALRRLGLGVTRSAPRG